MPEPVRLHLARFDRHGTTRARLGRRWIEVEHGIPGELVEARVDTGSRPRGHIIQVLERSPERTEPPCVYFRDWACGGCQWQQLTYPGQLGFKRLAVETAMEDAGLDLAVDEIHALDDPWRYRSTAGIALGRRAGFRRQASLAIVPIRDCPISDPAIGALMAALNDALEGGDLPDFRGRVRLDVRLADGDTGPYLQVLIVPDSEKTPANADLAVLRQVLADLPSVGSILQLRPGSEIETIKGDPFGWIDVSGRPVALSAASFFQTNLRLLPDLLRRIKEEAGPLRGQSVADVYGGVGILGLWLADSAQQVTIIESSGWALEAGRLTAAAWGIENVRFVEGDAEENMDACLGADLVIVDPPRSGLSDTVQGELDALRPATILYVSCLAESLARDLADLTAGGYRVHRLELFDFYPQTYHVELLAVLRR